VLSTLFVGEAILEMHSIRDPARAELDRPLMPIKAPEVEEEEESVCMLGAL